MSNSVVAKRGRRHLIFASLSFFLLLYLSHVSFLSYSKNRFDTAFLILLIANFIVVITAAIHVFLAYLMIFKYRSFTECGEIKRILKIITYKDCPEKLFIVRCEGRMWIVEKICHFP